MGSFNTTCAISNTPILEGDEVRLFLLASNVYYIKPDLKRTGLFQGSPSYPWDNFTVIGGFPLKAKYADYNKYAIDEESIEARIIMSNLRQSYVMQTREEGKEYTGWVEDYFDIPASDLTWELVFEMQHYSCFWLRGYADYNYPYLGIMAIHESVYQLMLDEEYEEYIGYPEGLDYRSDYHPYTTVNFNILLEKELKRDLDAEKAEKAKEFRKYFEDELDNGEITEEKVQERTMIMAESSIMDRDSHKMHYAYNTRSIYNDIVRCVTKYNEKNPDKAIELDLTAIRTLEFEAMYFVTRMNERNMVFCPTILSGQTHDRVADSIFLKKVAEAVGALSAEYENEEHIETKKITTTWQEVTVPQIVERLTDWYDDKELDEHLNYIKSLIGDNDVVIITKDDFTKDENKFLRSIIPNNTLDLHLKAQ